MTVDGKWDVTKPVDHTLIGDVPGEIRGLKSCIVIVLSKEHISPVSASADNIGMQHVKGSCRVFLQSGFPVVDPEGNGLETGISTSATYDDGRLAADTSNANKVKVYLASQTSVASGWREVCVGVVIASTNIDANSKNIVSLADGTQSGQGVHVGQIDTSVSTGRLKLIEPSTSGKFGVRVLDPPTADEDITSKKYVDSVGFQTCNVKVKNNVSIPTSWTDIDLSGIVGVRPALVVLFVQPTQSFSDPVYVRFRQNGETVEQIGSGVTWTNAGGIASVALDNEYGGYVMILTDSSGVIEWICDASGDEANVWIKAYII